MTVRFHPRKSIEQVEEGHELAPQFDGNGVIPVVTTDFASGELLMHLLLRSQPGSAARELEAKTIGSFQ
ncbi:MAG: hypothetical protein AAFY98_09875 [Verrucomicrobiota bacterium]